MVSTASSSRAAASRTTAGSSVGAAQRLGAGQRREVVPPHLQHDRSAPTAPAARSRRTQRSASRSTSSRTRTRSCRSTSKVSSTETDFASRSATTGRSSQPGGHRVQRRARAPCPAAGPARPRPPRRSRRRCVMPARRRCSRGGRARPPAGSAPASGPSSSRSRARLDDHQPVRLGLLGGDLGEHLGAGEAHRPGQPGDGADVRPQPLADRRADASSGRGAARLQVDERLVQAQRLHQRRQPPQQPHHLLADLRGRGRSAARDTRRSGTSRRACAMGIAEWTPKTPRLVRRGGDHPARPEPAHDHGLSAQARLGRLLRRRRRRHPCPDAGSSARFSHLRCCPTPLTIGPHGARAARRGGSAAPGCARLASSSAGLCADQRLAGVDPLAVQLRQRAPRRPARPRPRRSRRRPGRPGAGRRPRPARCTRRPWRRRSSASSAPGRRGPRARRCWTAVRMFCSDTPVSSSRLTILRTTTSRKL